jgi:predicted negative regulator of RcsB-dependent stress response
MSVYMTETEQLESIKRWWKRYSYLITVFFSVVLLIISGYKYWNWHQEKINQQASNAYEQLIVSFSNQDYRAVRSYASQLKKDYSASVYADAARLTLVKVFVSQEKYAKARDELDYVAKHSKMPALREIAQIRLVRLLLAEKSFDKALVELSQVDSLTYKSLVNELRGDIYAAIGQPQKAVLSYKKAIDEVQMNGMGNPFLEMKTNELAMMTQTKNNVEGEKLKAA